MCRPWGEAATSHRVAGIRRARPDRPYRAFTFEASIPAYSAGVPRDRALAGRRYSAECSARATSSGVLEGITPRFLQPLLRGRAEPTRPPQ